MNNDYHKETNNQTTIGRIRRTSIPIAAIVICSIVFGFLLSVVIVGGGKTRFNHEYEDEKYLNNTTSVRYSDSRTLKEASAESENTFIISELEVIRNYIDDSNYEAAYNECIYALEIVPNQSEIVTLRDYCKAQLPVSLTECFSSGKWSLSKNEVSDMFGNTYKAGTAYMEDTATMSLVVTDLEAEFYLNREYTSVSLGIVPYCAFGDGQYGIFYVYADDELIYETEVNNHTTPDILVLDITNVRFLKLEYKTNTCNVPLIIVDPILKKDK